MRSYTVLSGHYVKLMFSGKMHSLVLTMHKTLLIDWLTYVQNILQPSFVDAFNVL